MGQRTEDRRQRTETRRGEDKTKQNKPRQGTRRKRKETQGKDERQALVLLSLATLEPCLGKGGWVGNAGGCGAAGGNICHRPTRPHSTFVLLKKERKNVEL
mmetsp:Transcript_93561/g.195046  ORF Transcript_93561/g.195046 Transcript_93561/m.195046 type:complete len:101 (-) Transcript_93561:69-371(-)